MPNVAETAAGPGISGKMFSAPGVLGEWNGPPDRRGGGRKDLAAPGRRRWLGAHSLASV